jgi:hypothetical protein
MPGLLLGPNNQSIFAAKWNPASRKKVLLTNNFARIRKTGIHFCGIRAQC